VLQAAARQHAVDRLHSRQLHAGSQLANSIASPASRLVQMVMGAVPNKDMPDEGGIIVEGVMGLELKRSRVQHTVFTVSRHSVPRCPCNERRATVCAWRRPCGKSGCGRGAATAQQSLLAQQHQAAVWSPAVSTAEHWGPAMQGSLPAACFDT
jgi:hypothetical protein